jgi:hypothetical protein
VGEGAAVGGVEVTEAAGDGPAPGADAHGGDSAGVVGAGAP